MDLDLSIREAVLAAVPELRAFAVSLRGNIRRADDLVQETLVQALLHIELFGPDTNMTAWLFTILRNLFRCEYRNRRREAAEGDGSFAETLRSQPEQDRPLKLQKFHEALTKLSSHQREALILIGASGFSYEEAADICGVPVGTIKSRVSRARTKLVELLSIEGAEDFGPDRATHAVLARDHRHKIANSVKSVASDDRRRVEIVATWLARHRLAHRHEIPPSLAGSLKAAIDKAEDQLWPTPAAVSRAVIEAIEHARVAG